MANRELVLSFELKFKDTGKVVDGHDFHMLLSNCDIDKMKIQYRVLRVLLETAQERFGPDHMAQSPHKGWRQALGKFFL